MPESIALAPWASLVLFIFATSITPGPNNLMLAVTGARFGLRATVPPMVGILLGLCLLLGLASAGAAALLLAAPGLELALRVLGLGYLLWLAWRLCAPDTCLEARRLHRPLNAGEAAIFQFANPKAWMMAVTAATTFLPGLLPAAAEPGDRITATLAMTLCFVVVGGPCTASWAVLGATLQRWLRQGARLQRFNTVMGGLLVVTALGMVWV